jgi:hypothetical protein
MASDKFKVSDSVKIDIVRNIIEPSYIEDIKSNINLKNYWKKSGITFETLSKVFVGVSSIVSFSSGIYDIPLLSFLAGSTSVISLVLLQYASHSFRESKKNVAELNMTLKKLELDTMPDNIIPNATNNDGTTPMFRTNENENKSLSRRNSESGSQGQDNNSSQGKQQSVSFLPQKIMKHRIQNGIREFLIKWNDSKSDEDDTWETQDDIMKLSPEIVLDYLKTIKFDSDEKF